MTSFEPIYSVKGEVLAIRVGRNRASEPISSVTLDDLAADVDEQARMNQRLVSLISRAGSAAK